MLTTAIPPLYHAGLVAVNTADFGTVFQTEHLPWSRP
jgi:hypothetical protein